MKKSLMVFWIVFLLSISTSIIAFAADTVCCGYSSPDNPFNCTTHSTEGHEGDHGNCTWWCAYKRPEVSGPCIGDAVLWLDQARAGGLPVGQIPAVGSIAVFDSYFESGGQQVNGGHVAYVESVNSDGSFNVTEMGYEAWNCMRTNTLTRTSYDGLQGFIFPGQQYHFTFPSGSSEGMTPNSNMTEAPLGSGYNEWRVQVSGSDPGIDSPSYPAGLLAKNIVIEFAAKAITGGDHPISEGRVYVKDENNSWNNSVPLQLINGEVGYNNGQFAVDNYNVYRAALSEMTRSEAQMRQFSIQLTDGHSTSETWTFDWIKVKVVGWDFKDDSLGWTIRQHGSTADFFVNEFWRINPTGSQPQIASPEDLMIADFFTKIGIRYSVQNSASETARAYYDVGSGFSSACMSQTTVTHDGSSKTVIFDLPSCAIGNTTKVLFDLFDNSTYQNKLIAVNNISFLAEDSAVTVYEVPTFSSFLSASGGGLYEPTNLRYSNLSSTSITLLWDKGLNADDTNLDWGVYQGSAEIDTSNVKTYTVTGLSPNTPYTFKTTAKAGGEESNFSNVLSVTTPANSVPPEGYTFSAFYTSEWEQPNSGSTTDGVAQNTFCRGDANPFCVFTKLTGVINYGSIDLTYKWYSPDGQLQFTDDEMYGYEGDTWWIFREYDARSTALYGTWKVEVYEKTYDGDNPVYSLLDDHYFEYSPCLSAPTNLGSSNVSSSSLRVTWGAPGYAIGYEVFRQDGDDWIPKGNVSTLYFDDSNLDPGTSYHYRLFSTAGAYVSTNYAEITVTTTTTSTVQNPTNLRVVEQP